jgi:hypothetical protein
MHSYSRRKSGNIYKTVYVEDATGAYKYLLNAGGCVGDKIVSI